VSIKSDILVRVRVVFFFIALFGLLILGRIIKIQYVDGDLWLAKAAKSLVKQRSIKADRGNIYDCEGRDLAVSIPFFKLAFDPSISNVTTSNKEIYDLGIDTLTSNLAAFYRDGSGLSYKRKITRARDKGRRYLVLNSKSINYLEKKKMQEWPIFREGAMHGGVIFEKENKRFKPHQGLARRTIGDVREAEEGGKKGQTGIEYSFNKQLAGRDGQAMFAKISSKHWKNLHSKESVNPQQGLDIHTTIDIDIQDVAENALLKALQENEADNGCAIVMDVKTGQIRAIANLDRMTDSKGNVSYKELYNYAVAGKREPGSTMKLASMMAVLESNPELNLLNDSISVGKGIWDFSGTDMRDSHLYNEDHTYSIQEAFEISSNIGIARLAMNEFGETMDRQTMFTNYMSDFMISKSMGFQLKGSAQPEMPTPASNTWSAIALPWIAHGYGIEMSPLQILAFYNAVANDGYYNRPLIVSTVKADNKVIEDFTGVKARQICSETTAKKLQQLLLGVVEHRHGTAKNIRNKNYLIAGKTGTAKKLAKKTVNGKRVYEKKYYSSFAGYFPADKPRYSIIVAIDNAKKGKIYGGDLCAPVFKEIADKIYSNEIEMHQVAELNKTANDLPRITAGYRPDIEFILNESHVELSQSSSFDADYVSSSRASNNSVYLRENTIMPNVIPKVVGMTLKDALPLLENKGLKVIFRGSGRVISQSKSAGSNLLVGSTIRLVLSE
jgi:cell division protein FtsI (penicillin-binding protein 3)